MGTLRKFTRKENNWASCLKVFETGAVIGLEDPRQDFKSLGWYFP